MLRCAHLRELTSTLPGLRAILCLRHGRRHASGAQGVYRSGQVHRHSAVSMGGRLATSGDFVRSVSDWESWQVKLGLLARHACADISAASLALYRCAKLT